MSTQAIVKSEPAEEYHKAPGLSNSGLRDLAVSPLRYWHLHINPNRPEEEPTTFMKFGSALHATVLEPATFEDRYCQKLDASDIEGCLVTMDDLRKYLKSLGITPKGTRKADLIKQVQEADEDAPIFDVLKAEHDELNEDKIQFSQEDWLRIGGAAHALRAEPKLQELLSESGEAEKSYYVEHNGVLLKARMDWVTEKATLDLKTLTARRDQAFDKSVTNAIWFEAYYRQAYFYSLVRGLAEGKDQTAAQAMPPFVIAFVESDEPYETRIREFRPKAAGEVNMLWERARIEVLSMIDLYREYSTKFGTRPWRYAQPREPLVDEEFSQLAYA